MLRPVFYAPVLLTAALVPAIGAGCSADGESSGFTGGDGPASSSATVGGGGGIGGAGQQSSAAGIEVDGGLGGSGGFVTCDPKGPDDDVDQDGYTPNQGDCHDCDKNVNPNAIEVPTEEGKDVYDEDCDGEEDEVDEVLCDSGLVIDEMDALVALQALELCKVSSGPADWGLVSAKWTLADGSPPPSFALANFHLGHGILPKFGANVKVRKGEQMLALSSGTARQPDDPGYQDVGGFPKGFTSPPPQGFPKESAACPGVTTGQPNDAAAIELEMRTPSNAQGFSFDFDFFTYEWPNFVCSGYNDFFVALLMPFPPNQVDGNISFDSAGNPISVNNALLEVCGCAGNPPNACSAGGKQFNCSLGNTDLIGTGFGFDTAQDEQDHGSTAWLRSKAPVEPASDITIRFAVYDSGDGVLDTTTLIDNFKWIGVPGVTVGTDPVPD
ncbi:MAG: choice-of-anchor L domain-containing protein [Polyangiaceae bacterium]